MAFDREQFVAGFLEDWISKGLTLTEMEKVSEVFADTIEELAKTAGNKFIEELHKMAAAPAVASPSSPADAVLSAIPGAALFGGLGGLISGAANKGMDVAQNVAGTAISSSPYLLAAGLVAPYALGRFAGGMAGENLDESGVAVRSLKDREILRALRDATTRIQGPEVEQEDPEKASLNFS